MLARQGLLAGGMILAVLACDILRADEPVAAGTSTNGTVQTTCSQPVARRTRRFFLFGGSVYTSSSKAAPVTATTGTATSTSSAGTIAVPTTAMTTTVTRVTRQQDDQQPSLLPTTTPTQPESRTPAVATQLSGSVFGSSAVPTSTLTQERRSRASGGNSDVVSGRESNVRATTDAGSLLSKSSQARGVNTQQRTPIMTDTRIRGSGVGRMVASGG